MISVFWTERSGLSTRDLQLIKLVLLNIVSKRSHETKIDTKIIHVSLTHSSFPDFKKQFKNWNIMKLGDF